MNYCDLHTHSVYSDGSSTPAEIISEARQRGLIIALTDHNTVAGLPEFILEAERQGVTALTGIELSTDYEGTELHLLGLFIDPEQFEAVEFFTKEAHLLKEFSNIEMIERLNAAGYEIDYITIKKKHRNDNINRAHIAAELMEHGYVKTITEAFETILGEDRGYYISPPRTKLFDAITFLRNVHALPILAHPLQELSEASLRRLLPSAIEAGLVGIEAYHSSYSIEQIQTAHLIAEEFGIQVSGGSDFHGSNKPDIQLGIGKGQLAIADSVYYKLLQFKQTEFE